MKKSPKQLAFLALLLGTLVGARAQATVYTIDQSSTIPEVPGEDSPLSDTVSGTITTDGTIGVLQSSDILNWSLALTDNENAAYNVVLTPSNSGIVADIGNGLSASATALSFNFSDAGAEFGIQGTSYGFYSGFQYFCFQATTGACVAGETIVPYYYAVDGVEVTGITGIQPLGVPESATWAMMLVGVGMIGGGLRIARRKDAVALTAA
jgi:hypothetical protein